MAQSASVIIEAFNRNREPERLALKLAAMASGPFPFLRGTSHLFYQRLTEGSLATGGPPAWISGDLHLENFGTYLGDNGLTYFDINDFDEAALGPATWDILRLATSVYVAAPSYKLADTDATRLASDLVETWRTELATGKPRCIERKTASGIIGELMNSLKTRNTAKFLDKRTSEKKGTRQLDTGNGKALPITDADRAALSAFSETQASRHDKKNYFKLIDAGRRIAGTGSLGVARYVLLIEGEGSPNGNKLLDLKAANTSAVVPYSPCQQPAWPNDAERVVAAATRCQAITPSMLHVVTFDGQPFVLRELQPTADRLNLAVAAETKSSTFADAVHTMGKLAAWALLRATGRGGSASTDDLIAYAQDQRVTAGILKSARAMADITLADWREFTQSYSATAKRDTSEKPTKSEKAAKKMAKAAS